ncbi:restriction endonuclease subunit R [Methanofervidicoccus sp. A16]|uniref:type I restriction endonuclease n=1 Tax=Methanofervidicoccus sp. A16 TaxID=2607662 RepID=UPI0011881B9D|nr:type I restriction endonuclease [Methanofervidicoccus sp. A16]AXI25738.1 restriction endonuclease subunit R [Methanofervidicoccus sp. A16]
MNKELYQLIEDFKRDKRLQYLDEAATKQAVVLRILKALGWDPFNIDEVYPEYSVGGGKVDYALRCNGRIKVFIEVKKANENLERHQEQLLKYSFQEGVKLAVLTNGISWWFYLPLREGSWEQRKFYTIEIYEQDSKDIVDKFEEFLSKKNVISDKAVENGERRYKSIQKQYLIKETLPKAWEKIVTEPDNHLVEILASTTEKLCGYKPDNDTVKRFLEKIKKICQIVFTESNTNQNSVISPENYVGKSIVGFTFKGVKYPVHTWRGMLIKIAEIMYSLHKEEFEEKVFKLRGRKRPYFTKNPNDLKVPYRIDNTDIYMETRFSADGVVRLSKRIISLFGYKEEDLIIETKEGREV